MSIAVEPRAEGAPELARRERPSTRNPGLQVGPVRNPRPVTIHTGAVLELGERDHNGTGGLVLKLGLVKKELRGLHPALEWVVLVGRVVTPHGLGRPCSPCVRVSAIPDAMRPDDWRPAQV